ncbi:hypothetical protein GE21DRAFT_1291550 [Neurospora crassa]|nr:hypothetical protein GE21DRAFT_1291550 [Neurospora crassa]
MGRIPWYQARDCAILAVLYLFCLSTVDHHAGRILPSLSCLHSIPGCQDRIGLKIIQPTHYLSDELRYLGPCQTTPQPSKTT